MQLRVRPFKTITAISVLDQGKDNKMKNVFQNNTYPENG